MGAISQFGNNAVITPGRPHALAFRSNVEIVVLPCAVVDANGAPVGALTRDDFHVYDNDTRRPIENFWIDDDLPLTLGVLIDASESQKEQLSEHKQTAIELLERILRPSDRAFVISVDENARLWADLSETSSDVQTQLAGTPGGLLGEPCATQWSSMPGMSPTSACGSSPLWDAIYDAARLRLRALSGNKALLILTDGFDSGSTHTQCSIGADWPPDDRSPGGKYNHIVSRIETDLRHRYVLGFRPERLSGKVRHEIRVEVTRPDLMVRARKTYFREQQ
jgi:hypothetical protein